LRLSAISCAFFMSFSTCTGSPALGTSAKPMTTTGVDGPALSSWLPMASCIARTLP
jgi:hypothetical protein